MVCPNSFRNTNMVGELYVSDQRLSEARTTEVQRILLCGNHRRLLPCTNAFCGMAHPRILLGGPCPLHADGKGSKLLRWVRAGGGKPTVCTSSEEKPYSVNVHMWYKNLQFHAMNRHFS